MKDPWLTNSKKRQIALKHGFRSGLEEEIHQQLVKAGIEFGYEQDTLPYEQPAKTRSYTPDFTLANGVYVETKGYMPLDARQKLVWVKESNPDIDLRIVFQYPNAKIYKGSKTTYAMWAEKNGFPWAAKQVPEEWMDENEEV